MAPHFGNRVIGDAAYDEAVRKEAGGGAVFGVRVVGAIKGDGPVANAKRATEHGPLVVAGSENQDTEGNVTDTVSIDKLRDILTENPTFFDSLYEGELARSGGPRREALHIFREVEKGIKGQGRREILEEIADLLGETAHTAAQRADLNQGFLKAAQERAAREEENKQLGDAERLKSLKEREDNLNIVKQAKNEGTLNQVLPADTLAQARQAAGLDEAGSAATGGTVPSKPEGHVQPATQQPGTGSPSSAQATSETGTQEPNADDDDAQDEPTPEELESSTVEVLKEYLGEDAAKVKGKDGARPVKADYMRAAKKKARLASR